jgi:mono/diheme cytochrome c family protein
MKKLLLLSCLLILGSFLLISMGEINTNQQDPWTVPTKYQKMENPYSDATDNENIGRILYSKHCKSCHGTKGKGDGNKAESIDTPIGDFTDGSVKNQKDGALYYKSFTGRDDMPSFEKKIKDEEERWLIINYIRTLGE